VNNPGEIKTEIAKYIIILRDCRNNCRRAEERQLYENHLAAAAIMFAETHLEFSVSQLKERVASEKRGYGWSYLSGKEGLAAEGAFHKLASFVENITNK